MFDEWQWALAILGAFMVGLSKTGIAGLGVLNVALFASLLPARESVGVLLMVLISADLIAVSVYRRQASWNHLLRLFPWAAIGVVVGAVVFGQMDDTMVRVVIGSIVLTLVAIQIIRGRGTAYSEEDAPPHWMVIGTGLLAGFTTMIANAAGPLLIIYLLAMRLPKLAFVGTTAWFFLVLNVFKMPFSYSLGLITLPAFGLSMKLAPFALIGAISGRWLITHINQRLFEAIAIALTVIAGVRLLFF